jgi:hypothetical protein
VIVLLDEDSKKNHLSLQRFDKKTGWFVQNFILRVADVSNLLTRLNALT